MFTLLRYKQISLTVAIGPYVLSCTLPFPLDTPFISAVEGVSALDAFLMLRQGSISSEGLTAGRKRERMPPDCGGDDAGNKKHGMPAT